MTLFLIALLPFVVLFVLLIGFRRPAYEAAPIAYLVAIGIALSFWQIPGEVIGASLLDTLVVFIEVLLIVTVALLVLNLMIETGALRTIKASMSSVTSDDRVMAMLLAWGLVGFIEGIAGFGTPAVLAAPVLVHFGFSPIKAVTISLIGNSTAVPFGAAGTPFVIGLSGLGISEDILAQAVFKTALIHAVMSVFITCFIAYLVAKGKEKGHFREFIPFAIFSALSFSVPYLAVAYLVGPELPAIVGGISAIIAISYAAQRRFLLPPRQKGDDGQDAVTGSILRSLAPFSVMAVALVISRTIPMARETLQDLTFSLGEFRGIELRQVFSPLYTPYFYLGLSLITALLVFKVNPTTFRNAAQATYRKVRVASIVLLFIIALTQLLLLSDLNEGDLPSMPQILGTGFTEGLGGIFVVFSAFLGALGSFMTGSATVSTLLFAVLQADAAEALAMSTSALVSLQLVGAGVGNMISLSNIAMAAGAVGLSANEGKVILKTIIPVLVVSLVAGLIVYFS